LGEIGAQVRSFSNRYLSENGVKPSVREIAEGIGVSEEYVVRAMEIAGTVSLDGMRTTEEDGEQSMYGLIADSEDEFDRFETKEALKAAMVGMTDTEKQLVKYRFVDELSQSETANKLGVSQMFVSRLERKLLARLKENLQDSM
jgi:RNA polymerase sigma-B factor